MRWLKKVLNRTSVRMVIGYLLLVCLPVGASGALYAHYLREKVHLEYAAQKQQWIAHSAGQLAVQLQAIERAHNTLQINSRFTDYIRDAQRPPAAVYEYIKYINYCFSDIKAIDSHIEELRVYTQNRYLPNLRAEFLDMPFDPNTYKKGMWTLETRDAEGRNLFVYRRNLHESRFAKWLGVLEIAVNADILPGFLGSGQDMQAYLLLDGQREVLLDKCGLSQSLSAAQWQEMLGTARHEGGYLRGEGLTFNTVYLVNLDAYCVVVEPSSLAWGSDPALLYRMLAVLTLAMLALSLLYFSIIARMMRRIDRLSRHIRRNALSPIKGGQASDEVGYLYASFNAMVLRIRNLMDSLHRAEKMQQDAAYAALQAKVQPHFLYGTLETIRMLAVRNRDQEVADLTFAFGQLMRYSLGEGAEVTLMQEFQNAADFLVIKKMRLGDRLGYRVDLPEALQNVPCPRFIVQPVVENAVTHGVGKLLRPGEIRLSARQVGEEIQVLVEDNGIGLSPKEEEALRLSLESEAPPLRPNAPGNGFALRSVHHRLKQFFGPDCGIRIRGEAGKGMRVTLVLKGARRRAEIADCG